MDITSQRGQVRDPADMLFTVQDCLVEMRDAPAVRDVMSELGAQAFCGLAGVGVAPGSERRQQFAVGGEGEIAVHHGRDSERADRDQLNVVASLHVGKQSGVARLEPAPDRVQGVGPGPIDELVLPVMASHRNRRMVRSDQHRLDARRPELDSHSGAALDDGLARVGRHVAYPSWQSEKPWARRYSGLR